MGIYVDDHSRVAYVEVLPNEKAKTSVAFLVRALRFFKQKGVKVVRVMTDNGVGYVSKKYEKVLRILNIAHKRTRPYTPKTNGKVERFIRTLKNEWLYSHIYESSEQRVKQLNIFIDFYNYKRQHAGIDYQTPYSRLL